MDEGFDCQFAVGKLYGIDQFLNWSIKQSTGLFGFRWVRIPISANKKTTPNGVVFLLAEDEGFEPPQTESESGVLPLHKSSKSLDNQVNHVTGRKSFDSHMGS